MTQEETYRSRAERQQAARQEHWELKRLAEAAWVAILSTGSLNRQIDNENTTAKDAWIAAEAMYAESERRRPQE